LNRILPGAEKIVYNTAWEKQTIDKQAPVSSYGAKHRPWPADDGRTDAA